MGKSDLAEKGAIFLRDTDKQIAKKIKGATTDSILLLLIRMKSLELKPDIQRALTGKSAEEIVASYEGKMYGHLKVETADIVVETIRPIRERTNELLTIKVS